MYLREVLARLIEKGVTELPKDTEDALAHALKKERNRLARAQLSLILKNIWLAKKNGTPLCQDTGMPVFYVRIGRRCDHVFDIQDELAHAIKTCTSRSVLRPNIVHPISRKNSGDNSGNGVPVVHYELFDGSHIEITFAPKGAGSENMSVLAMLSPGAGEKKIEKFVLGRVEEMGGKPCPPYILGIGIGGTSERCLELAKLASIRKLGERNRDAQLSKFEQKLLSLVNKTGIGPMGLGGDTTCLGVHIEIADCHTATLPVALSVSCWADRRARVALRRHGHSWVD